MYVGSHSGREHVASIRAKPTRAKDVDTGTCSSDVQTLK